MGNKLLKIKGKLVVVFLLLFLAGLLLTGCPQRRPEQQIPQGVPREPIEEPKITVFMHETGQVETMLLDTYLEGVVAAEMDPEWPEEALAAQVIIARSFTLKKIEEGGVEARGTDASTDIKEFQAYSAERVNHRVKAAVQRTRGEAATHKGEYINAWFHADAGGITATAKEGLDFQDDEPPYIHRVEDPGQEITVAENIAWEAQFGLSQVAAAVQEITGQSPGNITGAEVLETGPSGRATLVRVGDVELAAARLRLALGNDQMRSTLVDKFTVEGSRLVVAGKGYGHGVGMSQWGARAFAEQGKSAEEIVAYYFKNIAIEKIWE
jgi:stage II sporulation protein D